MVFNYKVYELDVKISLSEDEGEEVYSQRLFGYSRSRTNEHGLVEAVVQALHLLEVRDTCWAP
jgi:hypothetical protein